jgi:uncharacterized protein (DUF433 family)
MWEVHIQADPAIMMGKPVIAGTRLTVELVLEKLAAGETIEQLLTAHPRLTREASQAALTFAHACIACGGYVPGEADRKMNFLGDESVDQPIVDRLRRDGHTMLAFVELDPRIPDDVVLTQANEAKAIRLTADRDFGELVFRQRRVTKGVVLIRLAKLLTRTKAAIVSVVMRDCEAELASAFAVISPGMVRIRPHL